MDTNVRNSLRYCANLLTLFRFILAIPLVLFLINQNIVVAIAILFAAAITDVLDGLLARKSNVKSTWGNKFDPLADKFIILVPLLFLTSYNIIPFWLCWITIAREFLITEIRSISKTGNPASYLSKTKTFFQFTSIILLLVGKEYFLDKNIINELGIILFILSVVLGLFSGLKYIYKSNS